MATTITVEGLPELEAKLLEFDAKVRPGLLKAARPGAKLLASAVRSAAPEGPTGNLRSSVHYKAAKKKTGFTGQTLGPWGKKASHRYLVLYGHEIVGHAPNLTRTGKRTRPNDFVRRGREATEAQAIAMTEAAVAAAIEAAVKL